MTNGIWQLAMLAAALSVTLLPVGLASAVKKKGRVAYAIRTVPLMGVLVAVNMFMGRITEIAEMIAVALLLMTAAVFHVIWSIHRTNDAGLSRWWNVLVSIPAVNLFWWVYLLRRQSARRKSAPTYLTERPKSKV